MPVPSLEPGHFNHIALATTDPERCAQFYCEVLGFRLVPRPAFSFDGRWLYRAEAGVMIHLIHDKNHQASPKSINTESINPKLINPKLINPKLINTGPINTRGHHFAMQSNDITKDLHLLAEHGVETVERVLPDHGYRQVFFRDPDGNVIEIGEWPAVADMVVPE